MREQLGFYPLWKASCLAAVAVVAGCASVEQPREREIYDGAGLVYDANDLRVNAKQVEVALPPPNNDELVCREEVPVGSHRAKKRCFTREQAARIRRDSQLWIRSGGTQGGGMVAR